MRLHHLAAITKYNFDSRRFSARSRRAGCGALIIKSCDGDGGSDLEQFYSDFVFHEGSPVKVSGLPIASRPVHSGGETLALQAGAWL